jgi:hypothetical protein
MKSKTPFFSDLLKIIVLMLFLFGSMKANASIDTNGDIYSMPVSINASLDENIVVVSARPEIWNPSNGITSTSVEFHIKFDLTIKNNSLNLNYTTVLMKTEIGFTGIPSGLSRQNTFTATYNFSSTLEEAFNGTNLFNATINIYTVAPESIKSSYNHESINGSKIHLKNNSTIIENATPLSDWGNTTTVSWFTPLILVAFVGIGIIRIKKKI